jgi:hypothetical protein
MAKNSTTRTRIALEDAGSGRKRDQSTGVSPDGQIKKHLVANEGFRSFDGAANTLTGYEAMNIIRKGQIRWLPKTEVRTSASPQYSYRKCGRKSRRRADSLSRGLGNFSKAFFHAH